MFKGARQNYFFGSKANSEYLLTVNKKQELFTNSSKTYFSRIMEDVHYDTSDISNYFTSEIVDINTPIVPDLLVFIRGVKPGTDSDVLLVLQQCVDVVHTLPHIPIVRVPYISFHGYNSAQFYTEKYRKYKTELNYNRVKIYKARVL